MQIPRNAPDRDPERLVRDYADLVLRVCYTSCARRLTPRTSATTRS